MTDSSWCENSCNASSNSKDEQKSVLEIVYGTKVNSDGLNENAVVRALEFKVEQERTKQQFYRLENIAKSIELFKLANEMGVPAHHIASIFSISNNFSSPATEQLQRLQQGGHQEQFTISQRRPPLSYKFPPISNSLPPESINFPSNSVNIAQSPERFNENIGLNENVASKDDTHVTPYRRNDEFDNDYDSSNDNSHSSRSSNNDPENSAHVHNKPSHKRNFSVPGSKYASPQSPIAITPIINFARGENINQRQKSQDILSNLRQHQQLQGVNSAPWKKFGMVGKKHKRTRSGSSFGVIDLNILEGSKQSQELSKSNQQQQPHLQQSQSQQSSSEVIGRSKSPDLNSHDEKTCSEKNSKISSPVRNTREANSVAKLLNSS